MPNRVHVLRVSDADPAELERRVRDRRAQARDVMRARIVLLSTQEFTGPEVAARVRCSERTVVLWRRRFATEGLDGLAERVRKPPPRTAVTDAVREEILAATEAGPPAELGVTRWSSRLLADWLGRRGTQVSHDSIIRPWRSRGIRPWRSETGPATNT